MKGRKPAANLTLAKSANPTPLLRCGLCGKREHLQRTECCGHWICDDEASYQLFSYARNSCARNHRRLTLCGFHHGEGHAGEWQKCVPCRDAFKTEMYAYYGTNQYNFAVLADPPGFEPTLCVGCGQRIVLGDGGYSSLGDQYACADCCDQVLRRLARPRSTRGHET